MTPANLEAIFPLGHTYPIAGLPDKPVAGQPYSFKVYSNKTVVDRRRESGYLKIKMQGVTITQVEIDVEKIEQNAEEPDEFKLFCKTIEEMDTCLLCHKKDCGVYIETDSGKPLFKCGTCWHANMVRKLETMIMSTLSAGGEDFENQVLYSLKYKNSYDKPVTVIDVMTSWFPESGFTQLDDI